MLHRKGCPPISFRWGIVVALLILAEGLSPTGPSAGLRHARAQSAGDRVAERIGDVTALEESPRLFLVGVERLPPVTVEPAPVALPGGNGVSAESLQRAWEIALAVDQALEAKRWDASSAQFSQRSAEAMRWPTVAVEGSYTGRTADPAFEFDLRGLPLSRNVFPYAQNENAAFRFGVDVPLFTSGGIQHGIDAAREDVRSAELEAEQSANDLKMRVAEEYVAVLRSQRDVEVAQTTAKSLASHASNAKKLYEHGRVPRNDLLAAQVALSSARQDVIHARHQLDACRAAYNRRTGRPLAAPVRIEELPVLPTEGSLDDLTSHALTTRREPARITARINALRHLAASFQSKNGLQVSVRGEYAFEENRFRTPEGIASLGMGASWNLLDGGRNRYRAEALKHRADGLLHWQKDLRSRIALEVRRAWLDVRETNQRLAVASKAIQRAEENLRVARRRYMAGTAISTEVLDAETLRAEAYRNHDHANYDAVLAALRIRHVTGQL